MPMKSYPITRDEIGTLADFFAYARSVICSQSLATASRHL